MVSGGGGGGFGCGASGAGGGVGLGLGRLKVALGVIGVVYGGVGSGKVGCWLCMIAVWGERCGVCGFVVMALVWWLLGGGRAWCASVLKGGVFVELGDWIGLVGKGSVGLRL
ncbi:hypothetical protein Tco_1039409 [Tanacetum coccineum]